MDDLFEKEQRVYESALSYINEIGGDTACDPERYKRLTEEYGKILKQFRKIMRISDKSAKKLILNDMELREQVIHDALTGLYNRRFLDDGLCSFIQELSESEEMLSVLMIDVDFFKQYNDTYGHDMGDKCLRLIADTLNGSIRDGDGFVARYGGEEFIVVLPRADESGALIAAQRMLENVVKLSMPHKSSKIADVVTISIGYTSGKADGNCTADNYTKRADEALYLSKANGRNRCTFLSLYPDTPDTKEE